MNYDQARQVNPEAALPDAGKWRYTSMNDGKVRPIGYCSPIGVCHACEGKSGTWFPERFCEACASKGYIWLERPCPGHETREGAELHYYEYLCDNLQEHTLRPPGGKHSQFDCAVPGCENETLNSLAPVGEYGTGPFLCDVHLSRDGYRLAVPFVPGLASIHS